MANIPDTATKKVIICAPSGRDAELAGTLLLEAEAAAVPVGSLKALREALSETTWAVVLTEEVLARADMDGLAAAVRAQPSWSDLPFVVLTRRDTGPERNRAAALISDLLGNVTFLERPFHPTTFVSVVKSALRGRQRQYEIRVRIDELHEGEERLKTALAAGRLGSWELNVDTGGLLASIPCRAVFGWPPEGSFTYADLVAATHPEDLPRTTAALERTIATGQDYAVEYRTIWPDGTEHWAEVHARRIRTSVSVVRLVGVALDVTGRKQAETDLQVANELLEQRVAERTRELEAAHRHAMEQVAQRERAEQQLRQAQKMEMIGQLTGGVAHDFNNLLAAVIGNLDLLRKHLSADPRSARLIDGALQGANRGASLTQRLLAFARRQELAVEASDMGALVRGVQDLLVRSVGADVELRYDIPDAETLALVDPNQVELALLNLVVNARDAMPDGGIVTVSVDRLSVTAASDLEAGDYVRLVVADTGHGMSPDTLAKATEPFFSTKELGKGTGLGLSMIHGLASQLDGALRLTSEIGRGTRAELWFPAASADRATAAPTEPDAEPAPSGAGRTILVVDDDVLIAMSTVDLLEDLGHTVLEANSGPEALKLIDEGSRPDLVITDFSMPRMNGGQLAVEIRKRLPDMPILLATGYAELPTDAKIDLPRLSKPYHQETLRASVDKILTSHKT